MDWLLTGSLSLPYHMALWYILTKGLQACLTFLVAVFAGRLFDIGWFKIPTLAASLLLVVATILVGECTKYWQLFLCQGLATGVRFVD